MAISDRNLINPYGDLACRLAEAVGLEPNNTVAFTIEVFPDDVIRVRSSQNATQGGIEEVARIFEAAAAEDLTPELKQRPFIPVARLEDLRIRATTGALTNAERLALAVLAGGRDSEEGVGALIDATQEEFGYGSYRVPVRIVGDSKRLRLLLVPSERQHLNSDGRQQLLNGLGKWLRGEHRFAIIPAGWSIKAFEIEGDGSQVEVSLPAPDGA